MNIFVIVIHRRLTHTKKTPCCFYHSVHSMSLQHGSVQIHVSSLEKSSLIWPGRLIVKIIQHQKFSGMSTHIVDMVLANRMRFTQSLCVCWLLWICPSWSQFSARGPLRRPLLCCYTFMAASHFRWDCTSKPLYFFSVVSLKYVVLCLCLSIYL